MSGVVLYVLLPQLLDLWGQVPNLRSLGVVALVLMALLQIGSWTSAAELDRVALPSLSRFAAVTTNYSANAVSGLLPGGGAVGAGLKYRMWAAAGTAAGEAASALAAVSLISLATLFALPIVTLGFAVLGAPVPQSLAAVAVGGAIVFVAFFALGSVYLTTDKPVRAVSRVVERIARKVKRPQLTEHAIIDARDRLRAALGSRWERALVFAVGVWACDYFSLAAALLALHTNPRLSVVLLAFLGSKILAMLPLTPGGLGVVEAGLTGLLVLAGISASDALLATLAYRVVSYWMSLPVGLGAYVLFRRRYHDVPRDPSEIAQPMHPFAAE